MRTKLEQETIIIFNEEDKEAYVTTYNTRLKNRIKQLAENSPNEVNAEIIADGSIDATVPKESIKINLKRKPRKMSEEDRERLLANLKKARTARLSKDNTQVNQ